MLAESKPAIEEGVNVLSIKVTLSKLMHLVLHLSIICLQMTDIFIDSFDSMYTNVFQSMGAYKYHLTH